MGQYNPNNLPELKTTAVEQEYDGYNEELDLWNSTRTAELNQIENCRITMSRLDKL